MGVQVNLQGKAAEVWVCFKTDYGTWPRADSIVPLIRG